MRYMWIAVAGLMLAGPAAAQLYKCVEDDLTVYSDVPCGESVDDGSTGMFRVPEQTEEPEQSSALDNIRLHCERKWGENYRMQEYCINEQSTAWDTVERRWAATNGARKRILSRCIAKWRLDDIESGVNWRMAEYCFNEQDQARERLNR